MRGHPPLAASSPTRLRALLRFAASLVACAGTAHAQYVGKVAEKEQPVLRAIAVYQYTGSLLKPNASRLVPVAVWDGEHYQPGSLYLARPEPLAVAPGTQYVLEQNGVPQGLFDVRSAAQLNGSWVGLGRARAEAPPPPPPKLHAARQLPVLAGGAGKGKAGDASGGPSNDAPSKANSGPTLHRKTDTPDTAGTGDSSGDSSGPTLHRRDTGDGSGSSGSDTAASPAPDPDRPTLHRKDAGTASGTPDATPDPDRPTLHRKASDTDTGTGTASSAPAPDPDRPTLHRHADASDGPSAAPDPDRPHLRYGAGADDARAQPALLSDSPAGRNANPAVPGDPLPSLTGSGGSVSNPAGQAAPPVGATVAVSDTHPDEPRFFRFAWPSASAEVEVRQSMHALALHALALQALAHAVQGSFGPSAASGDAALKHAATAAGGSFGPAARQAASSRKVPPGGPDPLQDADLSAWELSPGGGTTYVYSAHTAPGAGPNAMQRYVTVIAQADFSGKPQAVFSQTTRSDTLAQTPALHLLDAVDTRGDHRAELLFSEQTAAGSFPATSRAFAIYSLASGKAERVYATDLEPAE